MTSGYLTFRNCYSVITCFILIGLFIVLLLSNSKIPSDTSEHVQSSFVDGINKTIHNNTPAANKSEDLDDLRDTFQSERNPINQNKAFDGNLNNSDEQKERNASKTLLYRKRRYLLFPEGSSFQLVYDLIIPIVDYTNYAILGVTCALAWELPSKPPSEIENDFVEKLNDGTFGLSRNDSIDDIKYIDTPSKKKPLKDYMSKIVYIQPSEYSYQSYPVYNQPQNYPKHRTDYGYYKKYTPVYTTNKEKKPTYYTTTYNSPFHLKSINNERIDKGTTPEIFWKPNYPRNSVVRQPNKEYSETSPRASQSFHRPRQHAVYHIMGKRSAEKESQMDETHPVLEKLDRIHLQYHRSSRHALYSKLEVMFNKQGKNGTECVLRALCETGQRRHETEPGGFLLELLRAVFTLPEADNEIRNKERHPQRNAWDEAHWSSRKCSEMYPSCENFIFNSKYIY